MDFRWGKKAGWVPGSEPFCTSVFSGMSTGLGVRSRAQLCCYFMVCLWASQFCSLGLSFLVCRIQTGQVNGGVGEDKAVRRAELREAGQPPTLLHRPFSPSFQASLRGTLWAAPHYWQMALATPRSWAVPGGPGTVPWVARRPTASCRLTHPSPARAARRARAAPNPLPPRSPSRRRKVSTPPLPPRGPKPGPQGMTQGPAAASSLGFGLQMQSWPPAWPTRSEPLGGAEAWV